MDMLLLLMVNGLYDKMSNQKPTKDNIDKCIFDLHGLLIVKIANSGLQIALIFFLD